MEDILWAILSRAADNPKVATWIFVVIAASGMVRTLILAIWPEFTGRPKWAHVLFVLADTLNLNVPKALILKLKGPTPDPPLPPSTVRNAEKPA